MQLSYITRALFGLGLLATTPSLAMIGSSEKPTAPDLTVVMPD